MMYVPEDSNGFHNYRKPKLVDNFKDAQEECAKWNTGGIVDYNTNRAVDEVNSYSDIRPFDSDERNRAKKRNDTNS